MIRQPLAFQNGIQQKLQVRIPVADQRHGGSVHA
jgi:hypothetical protein